MKKLIAASLAVLVAGTVAAHAADTKALWDKNCKKCHGEDGKGKTKMGEKLGVKDYTLPKVQAEMKDEKIVKTIKDGVKKDDETRMKPFGDALSDEEIKSLVAYIRKFKAK